MVQTTDEHGAQASGSLLSQRSRRRYEVMISVRLPSDGDLLRRLVRAARERGVSTSVYVRSRLRQCVEADLDGVRDIRLGAVDSPDD